MITFGVFTTVNDRMPFAIAGDGTVALGFDLSNSPGSGNPVAQLDIRKHNDYDYVMSIGDVDNTNQYVTVHNDGYVGIGYANSGNATLQVITPSASTGNASVIITGYAPNDRYLFIGNGTNPASAAAYLSVKNTGVGIGIDNLSAGSTLAIKASNGNTQLDIYGTSSDSQDQSVNAEINIRNATGTIQHSISDDDDQLVLSPAKHLSLATDRYLVVDGNEKISGNLDVDGRVKIGNVSTPCAAPGYGNCYSLYVEKGILAERVRCSIKTTSAWSDYVFNKNYNLRSISELEKYINKNHHLPEIPSAEEVCKEGIDLTEMQAKLLAKIEELSLYIIAQQKEIDALKKRNK